MLIKNLKKCNKLIGLIRKLSVNVSRNALLTIYKSFIRPHLDYGDILYHKSENENFQNKLEKVQYRACLAITCAIQGTSREKLYGELGLHSQSKRRLCNKLFFSYKISNRLLPIYLFLYLTFPSQENYPLRSALTNKTNVNPSRTKTFKKTFSPYSINEWSNLNTKVRNAKLIKYFKKMIVTESKENFLFSVYDPYTVKLLTHLRLRFSHLKEHKVRHGFGDTVRPMCGCNAEIEDTEHFLLHCHFYSIQRFELFNNINKVDPSFTQLDAKEQVNILLYSYPPIKSNALNQDIIKFVINFLKRSGRFDKPIINGLSKLWIIFQSCHFDKPLMILWIAIFLFAYILFVWCCCCFLFVCLFLLIFFVRK